MIKSVNIVGAGNLGHWLVEHLKSFCTIKSIYSRDIDKALHLAKTVGATAVSNIGDVDPTADLTLIGVPDHAVQDVVDQLPSSLIVAHTSGFLSIEILDKFKAYGVFYPLQTISKSRVEDLNNVPLLLEASSDDLLEELSLLAHKVTNIVSEVNSDQRKVIHMAAVFANNFTNHLLLIAEQILGSVNKDLNLFKPLLDETIYKAVKMGPSCSQTGPAVRGDEATMQKHMEMLSEEEWKRLYKLLSESILNNQGHCLDKSVE